MRPLRVYKNGNPTKILIILSTRKAMKALIFFLTCSQDRLFLPPSNPFSSQVVGAEIKKGGIGKSREKLKTTDLKQTITPYKHK